MITLEARLCGVCHKGGHMTDLKVVEMAALAEHRNDELV